MSEYFATAWGDTADVATSDWAATKTMTSALACEADHGAVTVVTVDGATFQSVLISNRSLERWDSPNHNTFGLFDPHHRIRYVIGQSELFELQK